MNDQHALLILGCGDVGSRLGQRLLAQGWRVAGLRRRTHGLPAGIEAVSGDLLQNACPADWPRWNPDYLVFCAAAGRQDEAAYQALYVEGLGRALDWLKARGQQPKRLFFVSSSAVYGQHSGEWVDESSPTEPPSPSGRLMYNAERLALSSGIPTTLVRLTGIYGPGRDWLIRLAQQGAWAVAEPAHFANRIHSEDAAALLAHLIQQDVQGTPLHDCYLGTDDTPAPMHEVLDWLRRQLGVAAHAGPADQRRAGSKRCRNTRARALGWQPQYPSYREGYAAQIARHQEPHNDP